MKPQGAAEASRQRPAGVVGAGVKMPPTLALKGNKRVESPRTLLFHHPLLYMNLQV